MAVEVASRAVTHVNTARAADGGAARANAAGWVLGLFRRMVREVPAYARYIADDGVSPFSIRSLDDLAGVPVTTAENYLRRFSLEDLMPHGSLEEAWLVSADSSGILSSAPRGISDQAHAAAILGPLLEGLGTRRRSTLSVVAFPMGSERSGTSQMQLIMGLRARGHRITAVTPGEDVARSVEILHDLAPSFGQTIIHGTPEVVRDILTRGIERGIDLAPLRLGLLVAGEPISEEWRNEMSQVIAAEPAERIRAFYGSPETGVIAVESRATIVLRQWADRHPHLRRELFGDGNAPCPSLFEYNPGSRYVETRDGELIVSMDACVPLLRYRIGHQGEVITAAELRDRAQRAMGDNAPPVPSRPCIVLRAT